MTHQTLDPTKALHTWSLFRTMGRYVAPGSAPRAASPRTTPPRAWTCSTLPGQLAAHGFGRAQLCHLYLPRTDPAYLAGAARRLRRCGSRHSSVSLIDDGET